MKDSVEKIFEENKNQRKQIEELQYKLLKDKFNRELNQTIKIEGIPVVKLIFNDGNFKIIRKIVTNLIEVEKCIILTANMWGIYRKEWMGVALKTKWTIIIGITVILMSVVLVGIGNSL